MTHEQFEAFKEFFNELGIPENALAPMTDEQRMKIKIALHLQQPGFGLKNDEPKTQNKTVEGPKHGLSTMDPGQLEDFKEPGREYKHVPTVLSQEERLRRNDSFMAYGINIGIAKNALAIMTDDQREETMELIVELIKTRFVESIGQGQARSSRGNPTTVTDTDPNGAAEDRPAIKKDTKRDISVQEAGQHLLAHQREVGGPPIIEEDNGGGYRLITNDNGDPVSLRGDAWRALSSYGKACLYAMRKNHAKRTDLNGGDKSNSKSSDTKSKLLKLVVDSGATEHVLTLAADDNLDSTN